MTTAEGGASGLAPEHHSAGGAGGAGAAGGGDAAPPATRAGDAWLVAVGAAAATIAIVRLAPTAATGDPTVDVVAQVLLALAVATGAYVVARRFPPDATGALVALLTGLFLCGGAAVILNATPFGPLGVVADQSYRTAYLTKFGHGWHLVDYAYQDLPAFYPPLYFWLLGRLGALLGIASWEMLKVGMLVVAFVVPTVGWLLWRPIVGARQAAVIVVVTSLVFQEWYVPQLWLAIALFVPWWLHFVLGVGREPGRPPGPGGLAAGIALGAVVALTYWYVVFIGLVQLAGLLAARRAFRRRGRPPEPPSPRDAGLVLGGIAVVTAVYWLPLAVSLLATPGARTMQNRYFVADEVPVPLPFLEFDLEGLVLLAGLVTLVLSASRRRWSLHLLGLVVAAYALYLAGYVGFLADMPLDTVRTTGLVRFCLAAGAALGFVEVWHAVRDRRVPARVDTTAARNVVVAGAVVLAFGFGQTAVRAMPFLDQQRAARYPARLIEGFVRATGGDYEGAVVLTDVTDLSSFLPTYVFNVSNAHYSHPAARFTERANFLTRLARERDADVFALALLHNRYDDIDLVALREEAGGLRYEWLDDAFPKGVRLRSVTFPETSFESEAFVPLEGSELVMYRVDRRHDPLRALASCASRPRQEKCAALGRLDRYERHLDENARDLLRRWRERR